MSSVRLVAKTTPNLEGIKTTEDFIVYAARVSNPTNQMNTETSERLLKYLMRNKHWSPFEMASFTLEIKTTRDIGRQILRHRSFSFQEFSQRYAAVDDDAGVIYREARLQDNKNRQNSIKVNDDALQKEWNKRQYQAWLEAMDAYKWALDKGIAKEQARAVLNEGLTPSTIYMAGTVRSWIHYIHERTKNGVQYEHRIIAAMCMEAIQDELPSIKNLIIEQIEEEPKPEKKEEKNVWQKFKFWI